MPSGHDAASEATPYFFLSYAHRPGFGPDDEYRRNLLVRRFRDDLAEAVRRLASRADAVDAAAVDGPEDDRAWSERVSRALARCGTFVALYSDEYFSSEHCGREWGAFADRTEAIIPVLWQPVSADALPACTRDVQLQPGDLSPTYGRYGLNYLLRHLPEHRGEYEAVVSRLARRITEIAELQAPLRAERSTEFAEPVDAFHRSDGAADRLPHMKILIAALTSARLPRGADPEMYGPRPTDWKPFVPDYDRPIAELIKRFIESMGFRGRVEAFERDAELGGDAVPPAPTLLVIDAWAVQDASLRERLSDFDSRADSKRWIRPMVLWNRANPAGRLRAAELDARLTATLERCRDRYRSAAPRVLDGLETVRDFVSELPDVVRDIERRYFAELSPDRAEPGAAPQSPRKPRFRGPGPTLGMRGTPIQHSDPERRR